MKDNFKIKSEIMSSKDYSYATVTYKFDSYDAALQFKTFIDMMVVNSHDFFKKFYEFENSLESR